MYKVKKPNCTIKWPELITFSANWQGRTQVLFILINTYFYHTRMHCVNSDNRKTGFCQRCRTLVHLYPQIFLCICWNAIFTKMPHGHLDKIWVLINRSYTSRGARWILCLKHLCPADVTCDIIIQTLIKA